MDFKKKVFMATTKLFFGPLWLNPRSKIRILLKNFRFVARVALNRFKIIKST